MYLKNVALFSALILVFLLPLAAQTTPAPDQPVLDGSSMDTAIDPCVDFYTYSCGAWMKKNSIPPDQSSWSTYSKLQDETLLNLPLPELRTTNAPPFTKGSVSLGVGLPKPSTSTS